MDNGLGQERSFSRALVAGAAAGLAASALMQGFQAAVAPVQAALGNKAKREAGVLEQRIALEEASEQAKEATTEKAARTVGEIVGHPILAGSEKLAGTVVHYVFGTLMGMAYGVAAEYLPVVSKGGGTAFASALFLGTDEWSLPKLNLASQPEETPALDHALHWASHAVYGVALEGTRKLVRKAIVRA